MRKKDNIEYFDEEYDDEPRKRKKKKGGRLNRILFCIAAVAVAVVTYIGCRGYEMYSRAVTAEPIADMAERIRSGEHYTTLEELPDIYVKALVSVEDKRFYSHKGIDIRSIGRAALINIRDGQFSEGGSTITQQLAKNQYYTQEKNFIRKAAEAITAINMEQELSKDDILELYINSIFYGDNCYSIYDASMHYFGVPPSEMTDYQCTLLVGIPNAPSAYSLSVSPELAYQRQIQVTDAMVTAGVLTNEEKTAILSEKTQKTTLY